MKNFLSKRNKEENVNPLISFQKEMNQLFGKFFSDFSPLSLGNEGDSFTPKVNMVEHEHDIQVSTELPGIEEKDIDVSLTDEALTIKGEKKNEVEEKNENYHRMERSYGYFQRTIPLPVPVVSEKADASFKNGVLVITLPKCEEAKAKAKKIDIKTS